MAFVGTSSLRLKLPGRQLRSFPGAECLGMGRVPLLALSPPSPAGAHQPSLHLQTANQMWVSPEARLQ